MPSKRPLTASQPVKTLYTLYFLPLAILKVFRCSVQYLVPSLRPSPTWTYQLALNNELVKLFFEYWSVTRAEQERIKPVDGEDPQTSKTSKTSQSASNPEAEKKKETKKDQQEFVTIQPAADGEDIYRGPLRENTSIKPAPLNAVWYPAKPSATTISSLSSTPTSAQASPSDDRFILLHFHGGAYVFFSPQDPNVSEGVQALVSSLPVHAALAPEFRLASRPNCSFPAQLQDAVSAYSHLVRDLGIPASRILLSGDSAGGHLVVSLLRYLHLQEQPGVAKKLGLPGAALLHSPWLNLSPEACKVENSRCRGTDFLSTPYLEWGAGSLTPPAEPVVASSSSGKAEAASSSSKGSGIDRRSEWISPHFHPFRCSVPIWVQDGTAEVLHADIVEWIAAMRERGSSRVEYYGAKDMVHNLLIIVDFMGLHEERRRALASARGFLEGL